MKTISLPATMTTIPADCFNNCDKITSISIPDSYTTIGAQAFYEMDGLKRVTFGKRVKTVGKGVFTRCTSLTQVYLNPGLNNISEEAFIGCTSLKDVNIPEGVTVIEQKAFEDVDIEAVRLPNTLVRIEDQAFHDCKSLSSITIPEHVKYIGKQAFAVCKALRDVYVMGTTTIPQIWPASYNEKSDTEKEVDGTFDNGSLVNYWESETAESHNGGVISPADYGRACVLHFPKGYEDKYLNDEVKNYTYTDKDGKKWPKSSGFDAGEDVAERRDNAHYVIVDNRGELEEDGYSPKAAIEGGWKQFMLTSTYNAQRDDDFWPIPGIHDDSWYTMCFPFDLTKNQLIRAFGSGFELAYFCGITKDEDGNVTLQFNHSNSDMSKDNSRDASGNVVWAKAGVPYMIHPNSGVQPGGVTEMRFTLVKPDYSVVPKGMTGYDYDDEGFEEIKDNGSYNAYEHSYTFIGSYGRACAKNEYFYDVYGDYNTDNSKVATVKQYVPGQDGMPENPAQMFVAQPIPESYYFLALPKNAKNPKFFREARTDEELETYDNKSEDKVCTKGLWKPFTAVVRCNEKNTETSAAKKMLNIEFGEFEKQGIITGIDITNTDTHLKEHIDLTNKVYNLSGQMVSDDASRLNELPAGIYIVNGKKYVVK